MEEVNKELNIRDIVRGAIQEFISIEQSKAEPAYKAELIEERKRREHLETRVNELVEENRRSRTVADEMERGASIRSELQRLGVAKVDLAFKAVKDDIVRAEDGRLVGRGVQGEMGVRDYLMQFVNENPELLPARIAGRVWGEFHAQTSASEHWRRFRSGQDQGRDERRGSGTGPARNLTSRFTVDSESVVKKTKKDKGKFRCQLLRQRT